MDSKLSKSSFRAVRRDKKPSTNMEETCAYQKSKVPFYKGFSARFLEGLIVPWLLTELRC
jgi:hypothetical protein